MSSQAVMGFFSADAKQDRAVAMALWFVAGAAAYYFLSRPKQTYFPQGKNPNERALLGARRRLKPVSETYNMPGTGKGSVPQTADEMRALVRAQRKAGIGQVIDRQIRPVDTAGDFQGSKALLMARPVVRSADAVNAVVANVLYSPNPAGRDPRLVESIRDSQEVASYEVAVAQQLNQIDP